MDILAKFRPATGKLWLYILAGLMWSGVGILLGRFAYHWLAPLDLWYAVIMLLTGIVLAALISRFGFSWLADRNIARIHDIPRNKVCIFAFQGWTSYPLVLVMVSMGIFLRKFSPVPKPYLAILYIGIGGGLFLASLNYYKKIIALVAERNE
jgi:hypothetical protein